MLVFLYIHKYVAMLLYTVRMLLCRLLLIHNLVKPLMIDKLFDGLLHLYTLIHVYAVTAVQIIPYYTRIKPVTIQRSQPVAHCR